MFKSIVLTKQLIPTTMLYDFFKKHEKSNDVNDHLSSFHCQFSENQKKAIMCSLHLIAQSDDEYHPNEQEYFKQTSVLLDYPISVDSIINFMRLEPEETKEILNSLNDNQKDWYILTAFGMLNADGQALEKEYQYLEYFFEAMGITPERFENVTKKSIAIIENINKK